MKTKEQEIELYSDIFYAKENMKKKLEGNWFVHTCMTTGDGVLVIYERDLKTWN